MDENESTRYVNVESDENKTEITVQSDRAREIVSNLLEALSPTVRSAGRISVIIEQDVSAFASQSSTPDVGVDRDTVAENNPFAMTTSVDTNGDADEVMDEETEETEELEATEDEPEDIGFDGKQLSARSTTHIVATALREEGSMTLGELDDLLDAKYGTISSALSTGHDGYLFGREGEDTPGAADYYLADWGHKELSRLGPYDEEEEDKYA